MIKIILGFREDQEHLIPDQEAHKAYHCFLNPEARTVFSNGLAIIGKDIRSIQVDPIAVMGWNKGYKPSPEEWGEIRRSNKMAQAKLLLEQARTIAYHAQEDKRLLGMPLREANEQLLLTN